MAFESELRRFVELTAEEQWTWLAKLLFAVTMLARGTYSVGSEGLDDPQKMRRFNELYHRIASQMRQLSSRSSGMPAETFIRFLADELAALGINSELAELMQPTRAAQ